MEVFNWHPKDDENVIGPYFWAYLGIAGGLTLVTVVSWSSFLFLSKSKPLEGRESEDSDNL
jgi:hypothetical protein